jgi:hypothetical protein
MALVEDKAKIEKLIIRRGEWLSGMPLLLPVAILQDDDGLIYTDNLT